MRGLLSVGVAAVVVAASLACGGGGASSPGETPEATVVEGPAPRTDATPVYPPLDGPQRTPVAAERTNYRELPQFQLPDPSTLPVADKDGLEYHPPETPECPPDWEVLSRPVEGFQICHPSDWRVDGHGYVTAGVDDRWYALGLYHYAKDGGESAHVSIYVTTPFSRPFMYVAECTQAYRVTLARKLASFCPDHRGEFPEAKIIAYHVRQGESDYFINVVPLLQYDSGAGGYLNSWSKEDEETGIRIAQTIQFTEPLPSP